MVCVSTGPEYSSASEGPLLDIASYARDHQPLNDPRALEFSCFFGFILVNKQGQTNRKNRHPEFLNVIALASHVLMVKPGSGVQTELWAAECTHAARCQAHQQ